MNIAIIVFAYKRVDTLVCMLNSLKNCDQVSTHDIYFFSDGNKNENDKKAVEDVRRVITDYIEENCNCRGTLIKREHNLGLAKSVITGVSEIIDKYDGVICLEDDLVLSKDFIDYMDAALKFYINDKRIWSISGFSPKLKCLETVDFNTFLFYRACSLGWGTWKDRWNKVDWEISDYKSFKFSYKERKQFARGGNDLPFFIDFQMIGLIDSWAIRWCYSQWRQDMLTVYPTETRVDHIGWGEDATHSKKKRVKLQQLKEDHLGIDHFDGVFDDSINEQFKEHYKINYFKAYAKILLARCQRIIHRI